MFALRGTRHDAPTRTRHVDATRPIPRAAVAGDVVAGEGRTRFPALREAHIARQYEAHSIGHAASVRGHSARRRVDWIAAVRAVTLVRTAQLFAIHRVGHDARRSARHVRAAGADGWRAATLNTITRERRARFAALLNTVMHGKDGALIGGEAAGECRLFARWRNIRAAHAVRTVAKVFAPECEANRLGPDYAPADPSGGHTTRTDVRPVTGDIVAAVMRTRRATLCHTVVERDFGAASIGEAACERWRTAWRRFVRIMPAIGSVPVVVAADRVTNLMRQTDATVVAAVWPNAARTGILAQAIDVFARPTRVR